MFSSAFRPLAILAIMKVLSLPVLAQSLGGFNTTGLTMGEISYGGTGCPQGSLSFVYTISDTRFESALSIIIAKHLMHSSEELRSLMGIHPR
jgi:hypothetical protein